MSRYTNFGLHEITPNDIPLPKIDWSALGCEAPVHLPIEYKDENSDLPKADVVIVTWTTAEWSAFDHVFFSSSKERYPDNYEFKNAWLPYQKNAPKGSDFPLWGEFQLVGINNTTSEQLRILLFHSEAHLAYSPFLPGLQTMFDQIFNEVNPQCVISIGTAGGCKNTSFLGDTIVTNAGYVDMQLPQNKAAYNHQTIKGDWFPESALYEKLEKDFLFRIDRVCTWKQLENMVLAMHKKYHFTSDFQLKDLINNLINPGELTRPQIDLMKGVPLKTTDFYYIASSETSDDQYAVLEMDDAIIAKLCQDRGIKFAFFRNISDPLVRVLDERGNTIPAEVRDKWSGEIYTNFGFFTSFNGALACYAGVAGSDFKPQ